MPGISCLTFHVLTFHSSNNIFLGGYKMQTQPTEEIQYPKGLTFEKVWAALMELRETQKEAALEMKKSQEETARQIKATERQLGKLGIRFGEMIEYMVLPNLMDKFWDIGLVFTRAHRHFVMRDEKRNFIAEIDVTLENEEKVMLVEVKSKPTTQDISEHLERMEKARSYADIRNDKRKYLGAIAGMIINDNEKLFALKNGFFVIEPSGETFNITTPEGLYSPREW